MSEIAALDLSEFAEEVGVDDPVTIAGLGTRGGPVSGARPVMAPGGIVEVRADEMTVRCGAGTPVAELDDALAAVGQAVAIPPSGTVGGALAVGRSGIRRLGYGPVRDTVLQLRYVSAAGAIVKAGGPTVKNVSGFDLCRLLVGSWGTLGFLGEVILRTRPRARYEQWFETRSDPWAVLAGLHRPTSLLWDGERTLVLLEGDHRDVDEEARRVGLVASDTPVDLPTGGRWSLPPSQLHTLVGTGHFVAEIGVGVVHHEHPAPARQIDPAVVELHRRLEQRFDPTGRLNPGVSVLDARP
ncbi:MAG: FAD-binding protein [Ilumatobacter sp.]|nr:MAG: FAD-binding protein [Ilumatobacter sp.]